MQAFQGSVNKAEVLHRRPSRLLRLSGEDRVEQALMLFGEAGENRRLAVHTLSALQHRGLQQLKETAHGLQQHNIVRRFGDSEMKPHVGLRGEVGIVALFQLQRSVESEPQTLFIRLGGALRRIPGGARLYRMTRFKNVVAIVGIVLQQCAYRRDDALLRPGGKRLAQPGAAAATANQHAAADQPLQRFAQRGARHTQLGGQLTLCGEFHARLQLLLFYIASQPHDEMLGNRR